jgi:hypothetical protein
VEELRRQVDRLLVGPRNLLRTVVALCSTRVPMRDARSKHGGGRAWTNQNSRRYAPAMKRAAPLTRLTPF